MVKMILKEKSQCLIMLFDLAKRTQISDATQLLHLFKKLIMVKMILEEKCQQLKCSLSMYRNLQYGGLVGSDLQREF